MSRLNNKRILMIDDEQDILLPLKYRLESSGYDIRTATTGVEGLEKARKESPDLIVLDLMLPGLDGYQICGMLKHDRLYMKIPILILSARAQPKDIELGLKVGADAYVTKPFDLQELLLKIESLLAKNNNSVSIRPTSSDTQQTNANDK